METNYLDNSQVIGWFVHSDKPVNIYKEPGGALLRTAKPFGYVGKVHAFNGKGNWIYLTNDSGAIVVNESLTFKAPQTLTEAEKKEAIEAGFQAVLDSNPVTSGAGAVYPTVRDVVEGATDTVKSALDLTGFLGRNLKTILIVLLIVVVVILGLYLTNQIKSLKT